MVSTNRSCGPGGNEFGTEALFEHILVPQKQDFLEDAARFPGRCQRKAKNKKFHGRNFIELMLLYRKQEKKNLRRKELIDQNCPIGTRKQEKKASVPKEINEQGFLGSVRKDRCEPQRI